MLGLTERERRSSVEDSLLFPELVEVDRTLRVVLGMIHDNVPANTTFLEMVRVCQLVRGQTGRKIFNTQDKLGRKLRSHLEGRKLRGSALSDTRQRFEHGRRCEDVSLCRTVG